MDLRLANVADLPQLKGMYKKIIENMNKNNIQIWDEIYPCEFFLKDIENNCLYVLEENNEIASAFALCESNAGTEYVNWKGGHDRALYIERFGVNVNYLRKGIGSITINKAISLARDKGAKYLRLLVVDINAPAINLYEKNGFKKVEGSHDLRIDDDLVLHEFGFEKETEEELYLCPMTRELCHEFYREYENDPNVFMDMSLFSKYEYEEEKVDAYFDKQQDFSRVVFMVMKAGKPIGEIKLKYIDNEKRECSLGIHLQNDSVKGKGYGTYAEKLALQYAFDVLGMRAVNADAVQKNTRSQHVLEKAGFKFVRADDIFRYYRCERGERR